MAAAPVGRYIRRVGPALLGMNVAGRVGKIFASRDKVKSLKYAVLGRRGRYTDCVLESILHTADVEAKILIHLQIFPFLCRFTTIQRVTQEIEIGHNQPV